MQKIAQITVDYDQTLSRKEIQDYIKELIDSGVDAWVVTARFDDLHKHLYDTHLEYDNEDLWRVIDYVGIPHYKVRFTCLESKADYLENTNVIWHLDDNQDELNAINKRVKRLKTIGVDSLSSNWKESCNRLLKEFYGNDI
jgi:biotin operon repressor